MAALSAFAGSAAFVLFPNPAFAQSGTSGALTIVPSLGFTETLTDNYQPGSGPAEGDAISQIVGGLTMAARSGRLTGFLNYTLSQVLYARHSENNQLQQSLNAQLHSEFVERQGFVDASASISRQSISAFGVRSFDPTLVNSNSTEVRSLRIAPSWRGQLAGLWNYEATAEAAATRTDADGGLGDSSAGRASLQFNRSQQGRLSWSLLAQESILKYPAARDTTDGRVVGTAFVDVPEADVKVSFNAGYERSNVTTVSTEGDTTWGVGADWMPSPRTRLNASYDRRQFGPTHTLTFEHRTPRTVWSFTSSQQISTIQPNAGTSFFDLYYAQFASIEPDPNKRTQLVNAFLQQNGINANGTVPGSFLIRSTTAVNQQTLSFGLIGVRSSASVSASTSDSWQVDPVSQVGGDLANGQHLYQNLLSLNLSHRLTPNSSVNLLGMINNSHGGQQSVGTKLRTWMLQWSGTPSRYLTVSATLRRSDYESPTDPYRENAAIASLTVRF